MTTPSESGPDAAPPVVVLAPGRDGELSCRVLTDAGRSCRRCRDAADLRDQLTEEVGALLLAEEVLTGELPGWLAGVLADQPAWSDLPLLVVAQQHGRPDPRAFATLGNVTVLTRPMAIADLTTAVASALRARQRQFQVRDLLAAQRDEARRKDDFLAMLAHELRNPLSPVRYAAQALRAEARSDRAQQLMNVIERQVGHMGRIITQLLDVSRVTRGTVELASAPMDLAELARQGVAAFTDRAAAARVRLALDTDAGCWIDGDATRLAQVLDSLLDNALKFSPADADVRLAVQRDGAWVRLTVSDQGDGISADDLPHLFEPFMQADRSLERSRGGLGLGLPMAKGIAQLHGGDIAVVSAGTGRGSSFQLSLPRIAAPGVAGDAEPATALASGRDGPLRVVLAEDNEDAAETLRMLLELSGYAVSVAHTGAAAVRMVREQRPDVLLCDIGLPELSGYDVARTLRADPALAGLRMIAITGYGSAQDRAQAHDAGFDRHFAKPVAPADVVAELEDVARRRVQQAGR